MLITPESVTFPPSVPFTRTRRTRQTEGIALVVVLLSAMVLLVSLLAVTSTMVIASGRTTGDQNVTLQAQYAAEAGLARAAARQAEVYRLLQQQTAPVFFSVPAGQSSTAVAAHIRNFCGVAAFPATLPDSPDGPLLCTVAAPTPSFGNRYTLFTTYVGVPNEAYGSSAAGTAYWREVFAGTGATELATKVAQNGDAESWYRVKLGLQPTRVVQRAADAYRIFFTVADAVSVGEVRSEGKVVASRTLRQNTQPDPTTAQSSGEYYLDVYNPSFSRYVQFRDHTYQTAADGGNHLAFSAGEQFDGPVHTNDPPKFTGSSTTHPTFTDEFTTAAAAGAYSGLSAADHGRMFPNVPPRFSTGKVDITENVYSQVRAAMGGDENRPETGPAAEPVTNRELREGWGIGLAADRDKVVPDGVYFSKGDGTTVNTASAWVGSPARASGIYVKGNLSALRFSKTDNTATGRQVIELTQGGVTTRFEQGSSGGWTVKVGSAAARTLTGSFNGMIYVDGNVASLGGDGGANSDVAAGSQMTLASSGNVVIKNDVTYTDNPTETGKENAKNVLGIYTNGGKCGHAGAIPACGSIELDGAVGKDLTVHATLMASREGQGFGTLGCGGEGCPDKGTVVDGGVSRQVRINVLGGVIESQSQTVLSGSKGYKRAYKYDKRFRSGFSPPFFPKRATWSAHTEPFHIQEQVWQTVKY